MAKFPVTVKSEPQPTDPKAELFRAAIAAHPETLEQRIQRTRRYFRLVNKTVKLHYAKGLDSAPGDFA